MKYFYARVSTKGQSLARQTDAANSIDGIDRIFSDKESGKSMDRPAYNEMKSILAAGDEVIVKSLDRLGRNKAAMKAELDWFRERKVTVRVMDLPTTMMEFPVGQEWVFDMVNNVLIEVLGAIAEQERLTTLQRQREGIAAMPIVNGRRVSEKTGRGFGRPSLEVDMEEFERLRSLRNAGKVSVAECCERLGVGRTTWYAMVKSAG